MLIPTPALALRAVAPTQVPETVTGLESALRSDLIQAGPLSSKTGLETTEGPLLLPVILERFNSLDPSTVIHYPPGVIDDLDTTTREQAVNSFGSFMKIIQERTDTEGFMWRHEGNEVWITIVFPDMAEVPVPLDLPDVGEWTAAEFRDFSENVYAVNHEASRGPRNILGLIDLVLDDYAPHLKGAEPIKKIIETGGQLRSHLSRWTAALHPAGWEETLKQDNGPAELVKGVQAAEVGLSELGERFQDDADAASEFLKGVLPQAPLALEQDGETQAKAEELRREVGELVILLEDLSRLSNRTISRYIETHKFDYRGKPERLSVAKEVRKFRRIAQKGDMVNFINFTAEIEEGVPDVLMDEDLFLEIFMNITGNPHDIAKRQMVSSGVRSLGQKAKRKVRIQINVIIRKAELDGAAAVEIIFEDDGPGMSPAKLKSVLSEDIHHKTSKKKNSAEHGWGSGITHRIVQEAGGKMFVDSARKKNPLDLGGGLVSHSTSESNPLALGVATFFRILIPAMPPEDAVDKPKQAGLESRQIAVGLSILLESVRFQSGQALPAIVIGSDLEAREPSLTSLGGMESQNIFRASQYADQSDLFVRLFGAGVEQALFVGLEGEAAQFQKMAGLSGMESATLTPQAGLSFTGMLLQILSLASGMEQAVIEQLDEFQQLHDTRTRQALRGAA